jgi:two-component system invasion response regulator UvrY
MNDSSQAKLRIIILDDHAVVRQAIRQIVLDEGFDPLEFGEGNAGPEGLDLALGRLWDLVIVREGLDVLTELKRMRPDQPILVLTIRGTERQIEEANNPDDLVSMVHRILAGGSIGQSTTDMEAPSDLPSRPNDENLSNRELEVLRLLGLGRTLKEIAGILGLSEKTVSTYRSRTLTKLRLKTTAELIRYAIMNRLAD